MGRRTQRRFVKSPPNNSYFTQSKDDSINLTIAEFEAMRLKHHVNLNQQDAAEAMQVSQPTFSRILENGHRKVTLALLKGKPIRIHGGNVDFKKSFKGYGCLNCNYEWEDEKATKENTSSNSCPECESAKVFYLIKEPL